MTICVIELTTPQSKPSQKEWISGWVFGSTAITTELSGAKLYDEDVASMVMNNIVIGRDVPFHTVLRIVKLGELVPPPAEDVTNKWMTVPNFDFQLLRSFMDDPEQVFKNYPHLRSHIQVHSLNGGKAVKITLSLPGKLTDDELLIINVDSFGFDTFEYDIRGEGVTTHTVLTFTKQ